MNLQARVACVGADYWGKNLSVISTPLERWH